MSSPLKKYRRYQPTDSAPATPHVASPAVKQSWAAAGFIGSTQDAVAVLHESVFLSSVDAADACHGSSRPAPLSPRAPPVQVNPGDVFEPSNRDDNYFFYVVEVDSENQTATDKADSVKPWAELLNPVLYERIVTGAPQRTERKNLFLEHDLTHPERRQFFGKDGKQSFLSLIRNNHTDGPIQRRQIADSRTVVEADLARQIFLQGCRERCLPPLPVLVNCTSSDFPKLEVANLSLGRNYVEVVAMSLTAMTFLKSLDFSGNALDSRGASILISSVAETFIEEVIFDRNRIGKGGVKALAHIILNTPSKQEAASTSPVKVASSFSLPPLTSPSKLSIRNVTCVLRSIYINDNALGDHLVASLLKAIAHSPHTKLAELQARGNDVGSASTGVLAALLAQKGDYICRLERIDISWNNVQTLGAMKLFEAASENGFLKSLCLDFNGIQEKVMPSLAKCCNGKNAVLFVSLKNNGLVQDQLKALVSPEQLAKVEVVF